MKTRGIRVVLLSVVMLAAWALPARAQGMGTIFGKVTDPSGGVLPGATVTVTGPSLQQPLVAVTSTNGTYQFPAVPAGTFSVTFELANFKKAVRPNVVVTTGFNAGVDQKLELGQMSEEVTISAAAPVVDTKKTSTSATFTADVLEKIPTARDPWQVINMAPGVQAGLNVGGSASGQQVSLASRGTGANVQWNLEGGSITDLSSNSSPSYFDFDSFDQIQVLNGGGDVSVQSSGLFINLVTKSGSNVFKGSAVGTFQNSSMQSQNVTQDLFNLSPTSGNPIKKIDNLSGEYGGPILKNKLWFWGAADRQETDNGVLNFFDASAGDYCSQLDQAVRAGSLSTVLTYDKLKQGQKCLKTDKILIKDAEWKINYQLNAANKFQWLFTSNSKYRNARGADNNHTVETTTQQTSDAPWGFPIPTHSFTHTLIASDKLVFNNQFTYVGGGFFLDYQDAPPQGDCLQSRYLGADNLAAYQTGTRAATGNCLFNTQSLLNRTTSLNSRALQASYQTVRKRWEAKTDGTYFLTHKLGGDHSLKFGLGWQRAPVSTFSHYSGGARATVQCVGNSKANCGDGSFAAVGSATGLVPYQAVLYRDQLLNNDWWTYNGYIQDGYSHGKWRLNGGLRYDWQQSKYLGGCVAPNPLRPDLLPSQCEQATQSDSSNGRKIQSFGNWSPRVSATYDLFGNGKTQVHGSGSYYYSTRIVLANSLGALFDQPALTWGPNSTSGACNPNSAGCWTDANHDGLVSVDELTGNPTTSNSRFDQTTGILSPAGNIVDPSAKIGRTREAIVGLQHELISNLAVGVDFIYRKYDRGTATYAIGGQPGGALYPLSSLYIPESFTDPVTGISAQYYQLCPTCTRPSGVGNITVTNLSYQIYRGVDISATKRFSNRWQMQTSLTLQTNPQYQPPGSFTNPVNVVFADGVSTIAKYLFKMNGSYQLPWDINLSGNFNWNQGATRTETINGPGNVFGGVGQSSINYGSGSLEFQPRDSVRFKDTRLLDMGLQKSFRFRGGRNRIKLSVDGFNLFNENVILGYGSNNASSASFPVPQTIVPPRVFRVGATINF
jgi:hypothetical protein